MHIKRNGKTTIFQSPHNQKKINMNIFKYIVTDSPVLCCWSQCCAV